MDLKTSPLLKPPSQDKGSVFLVKKAEDRRASDRSEIGKSTWTLSRFKHGSITSNQPLILDIVRIIKDGLEASGYQVNLVEQPSGSASPVLKIGIEIFAFEMWSGPLGYVMIDGQIALSLAIQDKDGRNLQSRIFTGSGQASCWCCGCADKIEDAIEQSLNTVMMETKQWYLSESFRKTMGLAAHF
ncbi:MAG: hypothetical protein ACREQA_18735 [Candidatus Binatia bacterium]